MSILQEIVAWAQGLPAWQSDAVARLLAKQTLSAGDVEDLFALLKLEHGIPDPKGRTPQKLSADQVPAPAKAATHVEILAMKNMKNVNAIAENQRLPFSQTGITVIYGDNGSGKSGYSRVLKRACRARDQIEPIHSNANLPAGKAGVAETDFEIAINGKGQEVHWVNGKIAPPELSSLAIFDSRCARAYLDSEDDFSYVPYGMDVFESLAKLCERLKSMVDTEYAQYLVDLPAFTHLHGDSVVGKLIFGLSAKTPPAEIIALASLAPKELARHGELDKSLRENNPKEKAGHLRMRARRIAAIASGAMVKGSLVDKGAVTTIRGLADAYRAAQDAAALVAKKFKEEENLLPGTGGGAWRELFEAARRFALEAHPGKVFPELGDEAPCPLCQQPLGQGAERLMRFETFIQQETEKKAQASREALELAYKALLAHVLNLGLDDVTYLEIEALDKQLAIDTRAYELSLSTRREAVKAAIVSRKWDATDGELASPALHLQALAEKVSGEAETLEKASDEKARAALQAEFNSLDARIKLSLVKDAVTTAIARLAHQAKLVQCIPDLKTTSISFKSSELAEKVISKDLADSLNREFKALGVNTLRVALRSRSGKGKALHKLRLELPQAMQPGDILSEGEQRAVAIGSFLTEVGLSGSTGGIVFDDPVSSLDHRRRERVARRFVAEAAKRQVIVLTHDIYFLCLLQEEAEIAGVPVLAQSLVRRAEGFGVADSELPFEGKSAVARIGALRNLHQAIAKLYKDGEDKEHRRLTADAYIQLRMSWERAIEEVLLRKVVLRFRKGVESQRLAEVMVEDTDYAQIDAGMTKCSNFPHDKAMIGGVAIPDPDELLVDIDALESWRAHVEKRSKETSKKRKAAPAKAVGT